MKPFDGILDTAMTIKATFTLARRKIHGDKLSGI